MILSVLPVRTDCIVSIRLAAQCHSNFFLPRRDVSSEISTVLLWSQVAEEFAIHLFQEMFTDAATTQGSFFCWGCSRRTFFYMINIFGTWVMK